MAHVKCCTSYVTRHTSHDTRHTSHDTRHTSHVTRHTSQFTRHLTDVLYMILWPKSESMFKRQASHVTRHTSHVTRHTLPYAAAVVSSCEDVASCCSQQSHDTHRTVTRHPWNSHTTPIEQSHDTHGTVTRHPWNGHLATNTNATHQQNHASTCNRYDAGGMPEEEEGAVHAS